MTTFLFILALISLLSWLWLLQIRGQFWHFVSDGSVHDLEDNSWPDIAVIVPARNEAESIETCLKALLAQDYPGTYRIILVDDNSNDGTTALAQAAIASAANMDASKAGLLHILQGASLQPGWSGKLWALEQGVRHVPTLDINPAYILFTDADIHTAPDTLRHMAAKAERGRYDLVSEMVRLSCASPAERFMIPAFIFFFRMLYPFKWVNDPDAYTAAAAGGLMLIRRTALIRIGGLDALKDALIDDCSLAHLVKQEGTIHLSLSPKTESIRRYPTLPGIWGMIARTAFTELHYSWLLLFLAVLGMLIVFIAPPFFLGAPGYAAPLMGLAAWGLSAYAYAPALRFYGLSPWLAWLLPLISLVYICATLDSARQSLLGKSGMWKGRLQGRHT